jgi:hypothetical protein
VRVHFFTLSYTPKSMKCDSQASLLARTLTSPCLGCEFKVRVTITTMDITVKFYYEKNSVEKFKSTSKLHALMDKAMDKV